MSVQNKNIFQLVDSRSAGGIESHIFNLSRWLVNSSYTNEVIFLKDYGEHPLKASLTKAGIPWRCLDSYIDLYKLLIGSNCILSTHGYKAGTIGRLIAYLTSTPVISTYHSGDKGSGKLKLYNWIDEISAKLANQVISVSEEIESRLPVASNQIVNFVNQQPLMVERGKGVSFIGRLSHEKGPDIFARVTANLKCPCYVFGDGPLRKELEYQYDHLIFFGHVDMEQYWKDIGLLCISSRFEGLPLVALEAMSRGIPVVSFTVGGLPQLIKHNNNGWLVPNGNENALKATIETWTRADSTQKAQFAVAAHSHINNHFTDDVVCPQIVNTYQKALQKAVN